MVADEREAATTTHPETDTGLSCHWWCDEDAVRRAGIDLPRNADDRRVLGSVLANAALAAQVGQAVSYSRRRDWYGVRERYDGRSFSYARVVGTVDRLVEAGVLGGARACPGDHVRELRRPNDRLEALRAEGKATGLRSTFWASPELAAAFEGARYHHRLPESALIVLRDADGNDMVVPETRFVQRERARLAAINEATRAIQLTFPGATAVGDHLVMGGTIFHPTDPEMYRVFGRGSFKAGGRTYGWWQQLPKAIRASMKMDGEDVVEPDFTCAHAFILHARRGVSLDPTHDAYDTGGAFTRDEAKRAFVVSLCAKSIPGAISSLMNKPEFAGRDRAYVADAVDAVREANVRIADDFGRDLGQTLMNVDASIMSGVLTSCIRAGIPALPVHDSVATQGRHGTEVAAMMGEESTRVLGGNSSIPVKGYPRNVPHMPPSSPLPPLSPADDDRSQTPLEIVEAPLPTPSRKARRAAPVVAVRTCADRRSVPSRPPPDAPSTTRRKPSRPRPVRHVDAATVPVPRPRCGLPPGGMPAYERRFRHVVTDLVSHGCSLTEALRLWRVWERDDARERAFGPVHDGPPPPSRKPSTRLVASRAEG